MLTEKIKNKTDDGIPEVQSGHRRVRGCVDLTFAVRQVQEIFSKTYLLSIYFIDWEEGQCQMCILSQGSYKKQ